MYDNVLSPHLHDGAPLVEDLGHRRALAIEDPRHLRRPVVGQRFERRQIAAEKVKSPTTPAAPAMAASRQLSTKCLSQWLAGRLAARPRRTPFIHSPIAPHSTTRSGISSPPSARGALAVPASGAAAS
jgi:hypothetical protein